MLNHIELDTATEIMRQLDAHPQKETVPLENALDRILAEDIYAAFPMPPFDKSPFDGFALRSEDTPGTLLVTDEVAAGDEKVPKLSPQTAIRIFTGAPVPEGANVVVKQESAIYNETKVTIDCRIVADTNIIKKGEDFEAGTLLINAGETLSPAHLGMLASQGYAEVSVYRRPTAVILSTGSELSLPGMVRPEYGIYNSSYYTLRGYMEKMGFLVEPAQIIPDDAQLISAAVRKYMDSDIDLVITTGGASVGDYDYALTTAENIGAEILFWKVHMKPGGALLVSKRGNKMLFGLSGNPAAALMSILTVLQPYLRKLTGSTYANQELRMPILRSMPKVSSATRMLRGHMIVKDGTVFFDENVGQRNGNLNSFTDCSLIGVIPGKSGPHAAGDTILVMQLPKDLV